jgi:hypothetical protein
MLEYIKLVNIIIILIIGSMEDELQHFEDYKVKAKK